MVPEAGSPSMTPDLSGAEGWRGWQRRAARGWPAAHRRNQKVTAATDHRYSGDPQVPDPRGRISHLKACWPTSWASSRSSAWRRNSASTHRWARPDLNQATERIAEIIGHRTPGARLCVQAMHCQCGGRRAPETMAPGSTAWLPTGPIALSWRPHRPRAAGTHTRRWGLPVCPVRLRWGSARARPEPVIYSTLNKNGGQDHGTLREAD
jgi:hypothetical protein